MLFRAEDNIFTEQPVTLIQDADTTPVQVNRKLMLAQKKL